MSPEAPVWPQNWIISVHFEFIVCIITADWNNNCFLTLVCYQNKTWITDVPDSWNTSGEDFLNGQLWPNPSIKDRHQPLHNCWCSHPDRYAIFFCVRINLTGLQWHRITQNNYGFCLKIDDFWKLRKDRSLKLPKQCKHKYVEFQAKQPTCLVN